ncbi:MAG: hypothetical protein M3O84_08065 [Actinomycetota bacterium]|nr:hypothetical protein [Actinomycetota bacterium]
MPDLDTRFRSLGRVRAPELWPEIERREPSPPPGPPLRPRIVAGVVALLVAAAGFAFAERALNGGVSRIEHRPASAPVSNRIAFSAYRDGSWGIFSVNPDGTDLRPLTSMPTDEFAPAFSPDGSQIAFVAQRAGSAADADLYVMNVDGSGLTRLTSTGTNWDPTWSPDGTQIAFRKAIDGDEDIYVVGADGSGERDVSRSPQTWELAPSWSPDGGQIAFTSVRGNDQGPQIYVMNADGNGVQQLTDTADPHDSPQWSPDGTRIAFATQKNGVWGIDVMNADGSGVRRIAETSGRGASASWSPDGTQIVYETGSVNADFAELNVVNADGSGAHAITDHEFADLCCASWTGARSSPLPTTTQTAKTPYPTNSPTSLAGTRVSAEVAKTIPLGRPSSLSSIAYGDGSAWVALREDDSFNQYSVVRLDGGTGQESAKIPVDTVPDWEVGGGGLVFADGSLWVGGRTYDRATQQDGGEVIQIDSQTNSVVHTISLPAPVADLAFDANGLWVLTSRGGTPTLERIDPVSGDVAASITLEGDVGRSVVSVGGTIFALVRTGAPTYGDIVDQVDPATNAVSERYVTKESYNAVAETGGRMWMALGGGLLWLDPAAGQGRAVPEVSNTGDVVAAGDGGVWVLGPKYGRALSRYDIASGTLGPPVDTGHHAPVAMAVAPGALWAANDDGTVTLITLG